MNWLEDWFEVVYYCNADWQELNEDIQMSDGYDRLREHLISSINERIFAPGDRLPTERQLAEQFNVGRSVTRRALAELEKDGIITRHVGRGTFVRIPAESAETAPGGPVKESTSPAEYIEARLRFEPELAWMVATNGTGADFARMREALDQAENAKTASEFEQLDAAFHETIALATHNTLAIRMYKMIDTVRREHALWGTLRQRDQRPEHRLIYQREHREIIDALQQRDGERAREIISQHIRNTRRRLLDY